MTNMTNTSETENTIFLQAIDQNYDINKNSSYLSDEDDFQNGDLKMNFDFIDFSDEYFIKTKNNHKNSDGSLSNSSLSSESTEFESFSISRSISINKILTEKKILFKVKDILSPKYEENSNLLLEEVQRSKEAFRAKFSEIENEKIKLKFFEHNFTNTQTNKISPFSFNYSFANQQNNYKNYCRLPQNRSIPMSMNNINLICNNFHMGFFPHQITNVNNKNVNLEANYVGFNIKCRKNSYPGTSNNLYDCDKTSNESEIIIN